MPFGAASLLRWNSRRGGSIGFAARLAAISAASSRGSRRPSAGLNRAERNPQIITFKTCSAHFCCRKNCKSRRANGSNPGWALFVVWTWEQDLCPDDRRTGPASGPRLIFSRYHGQNVPVPMQTSTYRNSEKREVRNLR